MKIRRSRLGTYRKYIATERWKTFRSYHSLGNRPILDSAGEELLCDRNLGKLHKMGTLIGSILDIQYHKYPKSCVATEIMLPPLTSLLLRWFQVAEHQAQQSSLSWDDPRSKACRGDLVL